MTPRETCSITLLKMHSCAFKMDNEEEEYESYQWNRSPFQKISTQLTTMLDSPSLEFNLRQVMQTFMYMVDNPADGYRSLNFSEIAIILYQCTLVYARKVDLLYNYITDDVRRLKNNYSINPTAPPNDSPAVLRKEQHRRQRQIEINKQRISSQPLINQILHSTVDPEDNNLNEIWAQSNQSIPSSSISSMPSDPEIVMRQAVDEAIMANQELLCNYEDLRMNVMVQSYASLRVRFDLEFYGKSDHLLDGDDDHILQQYVAEKETTVLAFRNNALPSDTLRKFVWMKTCPQQLRINLSPLPQDTLEPYLKNYRESLQDKTTQNRKDSGYVSETMSNVSFDNFNAGVQFISTPKRIGQDANESNDSKRRKLKDRTNSTNRSKSVTLETFEAFTWSHFNVDRDKSTDQEEDFRGFTTVDQTTAHNLSVTYASLTRDITGIDLEDDDEESRAETALSRTAANQSNKDMATTVREWTEFVKRKIDKESTVFDMFGYESRIIESLDGAKAKETPRPFKSMMKNKSATEICRYFAATLQLANTGNVELLPKSDNLDHDFELTLLKNDIPNENLIYDSFVEEDRSISRFSKRRRFK